MTADETRRRLVEAAAEAFESRGFEGTRVADIAIAAGVSNGALYSHYDSKADLLVAALQHHGAARLAELFLDHPGRSGVELLVEIGNGLIDPEDGHGALLVEALVAARRDRSTAGVMTEHVIEREAWLADLLRSAIEEGAVDPELTPEVVSRFCLMLLFGGLILSAADLPPVDGDAWSALIARMAGALAASHGGSGNAAEPGVNELEGVSTP